MPRAIEMPKPFSFSGGESAVDSAGDLFRSLGDCPQCAPFRPDREAWLVAVRDCERCSAVLEAYEPDSWTAEDEHEGERLDQLEHFDPAILPELDQAPSLAAELVIGEIADQLARAARISRFHHWGLVQHLLAESQQLRNRRPRISHARAQLAVVIAENLDPDLYHPAWVADLNAKALASLARAERRLGRFREAERSIVRAGVWAVRGTNGGRARGFLGDLAVTNRLERVDGASRINEPAEPLVTSPAVRGRKARRAPEV